MPMANKSPPYLETVGRIVARLEQLGLEPILVGGMALVLLGSRRVTRDFDFLVARNDAAMERVFATFYSEGFELASRVNADGDIVRTVDNQRVALIRFRLDAPTSLYFLNRGTGLRIDLLLDFPIPAHKIAANARTMTVQSCTFRLAAPRDLLALKQIAYRDRQSSADRQDIEFLRQRRKK